MGYISSPLEWLHKVTRDLKNQLAGPEYDHIWESQAAALIPFLGIS